MYLDHNLQVIKEYRNNFWNILQLKSLADEESSLKVESVPTRTKEKALNVTRDDVCYRLNSKYNPEDEAAKWAEQYKAKNIDTVYVMFGFGNGIFLRELAKNIVKDTRLIVLEPSLRIFLHALGEYDLEDILKNENIMIIVQDINEYEFPYLVSSTLTWKNLFSKIECFHPGYDKMFANEYSDFRYVLQDNAFNNVMAKNTYSLMGKPLVKNTITNLPYLFNCISLWDLASELSREIPVIIAAAGPSLAKNIDELKSAKGRSIIVAVDRAYETFIEHNIEPDFVVVLDALKELKYCGGKKGFTIPLLCKYEASPDIMSNHAGKKIVFSFEGYGMELCEKTGKQFRSVPTGGSVANSAFSIFAMLGFQRIVLIGHDLAYDGETTHSGTTDDASILSEKIVDLFVEDIHGELVRTRQDWYAFLRWFEILIIQMKNSDVIDATEGGAKIKGTRIMKLKDVVEEFCGIPIDCSKIVEGIDPFFTENECEIIRNYLLEAKNDLTEIKLLMRKALTYCDELKKKLDKGMNINSCPEIINKITKINEKIQKMPIYSLIDSYILGEGTNSIGELYFITTNKKLDDIVTVKNMKNIYNLTKEACDFIQSEMDAVI